MYQLKFSPRAQEEIAISWNWYEEQNYGLGDKFEKAVEDCAVRITKAPFADAAKFENFREARLKRYPFLIIYIVNERTQIITVTKRFPCQT